MTPLHRAVPVLLAATVLGACGGEKPGTDPSCRSHAECVDPSGWLVGRCQAGVCEFTPLDADGDGFGALPGGGTDCDDDRPDVFPGAPERCTNAVDDDCDGLVDCADPDCALDPACCAPAPEICDGDLDEDCDGLVDCDDPDCNADPACHDAWPEVCNDGEDNDGNGLADCLDPGCAGSPLCACGFEWCDDGLDNDCDGLVDCDDPDCGDSVPCSGIHCDACAGACTFEPGPDDSSPFLYCGLALITDRAFRPGQVSRYACGGPLTPGQELTLPFLDEKLTALGLRTRVTLRAVFEGLSVDDLPTGGRVFVIEGGPLDAGDTRCDPGHCLAASQTDPADGPLEVTFIARPGVVYFVVVDQVGTLLTQFSLEPECSPVCDATESACDDGVDDDCDGAVDCHDPDCYGSPACP